MTTILRFILFFLLAQAFAIVAQAAGAFQDNFHIVDAGIRAESVILDSGDGGIFNYDCSGALLQQRRSLDGKAADGHGLESEAAGVTRHFCAVLSKLVATNKLNFRVSCNVV